MQSSNLLSLRSYTNEADTHHHSFHQLVLPLSGELDMRVGKHRGGVSQQQGAIIAAGEEHWFAAKNSNNFLVADIPVSLAPMLNSIPAFVTMNDALKQYIHFLQLQLRSSSLVFNTEQQMTLLLVQLLHEHYGARKRIDQRLLAAQCYLEEHFARIITLKELASVANLSPRQLTNLYKDVFGTTPQQYLINLRMTKAKQLLTESHLSVQQIAEEIGYSHVASFSDRFYKHFGHSPLHYRQVSKEHC